MHAASPPPTKGLMGGLVVVGGWGDLGQCWEGFGVVYVGDGHTAGLEGDEEKDTGQEY